MERLCRQELGLFPKPKEIRFKCSCPDYASMCKHVAAVLYGVGARLDHQPELLFRLRAVDEKDLVTGLDQALPVAGKGPAAGKVLEADDLSAMFGLDMAVVEPATAVAKASAKAKPSGKAEAKPQPGRQKQAAGRRKVAAKPKRRAIAEAAD
jgi:uncharacterized Zn finger protein